MYRGYRDNSMLYVTWNYFNCAVFRESVLLRMCMISDIVGYHDGFPSKIHAHAPNQ